MPIGSDFYREVVVAGRWLIPGDSRAIVLNQDTADKNDIIVGDTVTLDMGGIGKTDWQVVGLYQVIFNDGFSSDAIYAPTEAVYQATNKINRGSLLHVRTTDHTEAAVDAVTAQLKNQSEANNLKVGYSQTEIEIKRRATSQFGIFISMLLALAIIIAVVGGIGLMGALSISVVERTKEIGVLRAIGARSRTIMGDVHAGRRAARRDQLAHFDRRVVGSGARGGRRDGSGDLQHGTVVSVQLDGGRGVAGDRVCHLDAGFDSARAQRDVDQCA